MKRSINGIAKYGLKADANADSLQDVIGDHKPCEVKTHFVESSLRWCYASSEMRSQQP